MMRPDIILYAEDDENDAFFIDRAFKQAGIANPLIIVPDGNEAILYLSGQGKYANRQDYPLPCLVLMDLNMPIKSGLEVLQWIRAQPSISTLPVLILTSSNQESDIHRAYIQGANGYLLKPNKPNDMLALAKAIKDFWLLQNRGPGLDLPGKHRLKPRALDSGLPRVRPFRLPTPE